MSKKKVKDYLEPWIAQKDSSWEGAFTFPPTLSEHYTQDMVNKWWAEKDKADREAHWFLWGSRMREPRIDINADGKWHLWDGRGIIAFTRNLGLMDSAPTHEETARRAAECVNAMAGVASPEKLIEDVRGLLLDIVKGQTGPDDVRIVSCLARLIPADEIAHSHED